MAGALAILAAFLLAQQGRLLTTSRVYLILNLIGSALLAVLAILNRQWGFVLLEAAWAVISFVGLVKRDVNAQPPEVASVERCLHNAPDCEE